MSAILSTDTLNDFITPSVACIKPVETLPPSNDSSSTSTSENEVQIYDPSNPNSASTNGTSDGTKPPAQISLTDCLACSGCVTSAEAVLVSLQSHSEVLNALDSGPSFEIPDIHAHEDESLGQGQEGSESQQSKIFIATISPQTLASLSATFSLPPTTTKNLIHQFLSGPHGLASGGKYGNKFHWVVDTNAAREACLVLGAEEILKSQPQLQSLSLNGINTGVGTDTDIGIKKPILASSCPGWICYAEKTHPHILPHLSRLKSPQALTGTLLKTVLAKKYDISPARIWHVAVMPCFDKKLEASREELTDLYWGDKENEKNEERGGQKGGRKGIRDVDCVITSKELLMLAQTRGIDFLCLPRNPLHPSTTPPFPDAKLDRFLFPNHHKSSRSKSRQQQNPSAGTSGGHLWYILHHISSLHPTSTIQSTRGRNADVIDYTVTSASGQVIFKAARYYGFRNIQNLVRRLKPARASRMPGAAAKLVGGARRVGGGGKDAGVEQGYVEVMACPGGCTNGGGQVKVDDAFVSGGADSDSNLAGSKAGPQEQKEWLAKVDEAYFSAGTSSDDEEEHDDTSAMDINSDDRPNDLVVDGISPSYIKDTMAHWAALTGFPLDKLAYTSYREVVSDVGKKVGDTERVVQLAGKVGGGW